jgi:hypothetical protein
VRLAKDDTVCGIPAPVARTLLRRIGIHSWYRAGAEEALAKLGVPNPALAIDDLIQGGMIAVAGVDDGEEALGVTTRGSAVAMASFGRPITRATADRLLAGLLERARAYNGDASKPLFIRRLRVFGSYLDPGVDRLGDFDIEVRLRAPHRPLPRRVSELRQAVRQGLPVIHRRGLLAADRGDADPQEPLRRPEPHTPGHRRDHRPIRGRLRSRTVGIQ